MGRIAWRILISLILGAGLLAVIVFFSIQAIKLSNPCGFDPHQVCITSIKSVGWPMSVNFIDVVAFSHFPSFAVWPLMVDLLCFSIIFFLLISGINRFFRRKQTNPSALTN